MIEYSWKFSKFACVRVSICLFIFQKKKRKISRSFMKAFLPWTSSCVYLYAYRCRAHIPKTDHPRWNWWSMGSIPALSHFWGFPTGFTTVQNLFGISEAYARPSKWRSKKIFTSLFSIDCKSIMNEYFLLRAGVLFLWIKSLIHCHRFLLKPTSLNS